MKPAWSMRRMAARVTWADLQGAYAFLSEIQEMALACFPEQFALDPADPSEDFLLLLCGVHTPQQSLFLFCRLAEESTPVGFALAFKYHDSLYISTLCVHPARRSMGYASLLMRSASALAASLGLSMLTGSVDASNDRLISFYAKMGAHPRPLPPTGAGATIFTRRLDAPSGEQTSANTPVPVPDYGRGILQQRAFFDRRWLSFGSLRSIGSWSLAVASIASLGFFLIRKSAI
ncbi:MAG: hypothetical protein SGPRY_002901 [Prymnesium sp.]